MVHLKGFLYAVICKDGILSAKIIELITIFVIFANMNVFSYLYWTAKGEMEWL